MRDEEESSGRKINSFTTRLPLLLVLLPLLSTKGTVAITNLQFASPNLQPARPLELLCLFDEKEFAILVVSASSLISSGCGVVLVKTIVDFGSLYDCCVVVVEI